MLNIIETSALSSLTFISFNNLLFNNISECKRSIKDTIKALDIIANKLIKKHSINACPNNINGIMYSQND